MLEDVVHHNGVELTIGKARFLQSAQVHRQTVYSAGERCGRRIHFLSTYVPTNRPQPRQPAAVSAADIKHSARCHIAQIH
jgi:hypothetical protein